MTDQPMGQITTSIPAPGFGDLVVWLDETARTRIDRADPRIRLDAWLLEGIRRVRPHWAHFTGSGLLPDVLTFTPDHGRRVIYRVDWTDYDAATDSYALEWPD